MTLVLLCDGIGGTLSTHKRDDKCIQYFGLENPKRRGHLEDLGLDGKIILEWMLGK